MCFKMHSWRYFFLFILLYMFNKYYHKYFITHGFGRYMLAVISSNMNVCALFPLQKSWKKYDFFLQIFSNLECQNGWIISGIYKFFSRFSPVPDLHWEKSWENFIFFPKYSHFFKMGELFAHFEKKYMKNTKKIRNFLAIFPLTKIVRKS